MYGINDLKTGVTIEIDGAPHVVLSYQHIKMGRGGAVLKAKLKNLLTGSSYETSFKGGEKIQPARLERRSAQFTYADEEGYHFMDNQSYNQFTLSIEDLGTDVNYLKEGENDLYVQSLDDQGSLSEPSKTSLITVDETAPALTVDQPTNGQRFFDKDSPITISGKTEANINLTINGRFVLVKDDASFTLNLSLSNGDNQIELVAKDSAANTTKQTLTVNYTP